LFAERLLNVVLAAFDDVRAGSLAAAFAVTFFPVTLLGMYSPFAIRLLRPSAERSGLVSGTVYGVSTAGSILGTLGTTFLLIPSIGSRAIPITLGLAGLAAGLALVALRRAAPLVLLAALLATTQARAEDLVDMSVRAALAAREDGRIAHIES